MAFRHVPVHLTQAIRAYARLPRLRGRCVSSWTLSFTPWYLAVSPDNTVFITDFNHCIHVFLTDGTFVRTWGVQGTDPGQLICPHGIAVTKRGEVVVADQGNSCVQVFRPDGTFVRAWGSKGSGEGQFLWPCAVAVTKEDYVVVTDAESNRVQVFRLSDGAFLHMWHYSGQKNATFCHFVAACISRDGQVLIPVLPYLSFMQVIIADEGNHCVQVFTVDGALVCQWGSPGEDYGQFISPSGVAVHGDRVLVVDTNNVRVQVFQPNGAFVGSWGSCGSRNGGFQTPQGVGVTRMGQVLVCDSGNRQVLVFE